MENSTKKLREVQTLLKFSYGIIPIVAGADKFSNILVDWSKYLDPTIASVLPLRADTFMILVGIIEICAGILVLFQPRRGGYLVSAWLVLVAFSLLVSGNYLDVAVRDLVMAIGAFSLARISGINNTL
jgi:uncharacterized membrane protein YphA (DoxX/SURF4 family)